MAGHKAGNKAGPKAGSRGRPSSSKAPSKIELPPCTAAYVDEGVVLELLNERITIQVRAAACFCGAANMNNLRQRAACLPPLAVRHKARQVTVGVGVVPAVSVACLHEQGKEDGDVVFKIPTKEEGIFELHVGAETKTVEVGRQRVPQKSFCARGVAGAPGWVALRGGGRGGRKGREGRPWACPFHAGVPALCMRV